MSLVTIGQKKPRNSDPNSILVQIAETLDQLLVIAEEIKAHLIPTGVAEIVEFYQLIGGEYQKVDNMFMKVDQVLDLAVAFKDKLGNLAKVDGVPTWALTDDSLAKLEVGADGMSAVFTPVGLVGKLLIQVKADADLGAGVVEIIGELDVEISALDAVTVELSGTIRV